MLAPKPLGGLARALILVVAVIVLPTTIAQPSTSPLPESTETQSEPTEPNGSPPKHSPPPGQPDNTQTPTAQMESAQSAETEQPVDPKAMEALDRMGRYLASLRVLMFNARIFTEVVLENTQKLLIGGKVNYMAVPPNQLRVDLTTDSITRQFFHNNDKFTMLAPRDGYFAEMQASQPTAEVLSQAAKDYGLEIPFADLLEWGRNKDVWAGIKEAFLVNSPKVDGKRTQHWAFRSDNLDWEVWIAVGEKPLPVRISTVNTKDPAKPRFLATLKWVEGEQSDASQFRPPTSKLKQIKFKKAEPTKERAQ
ncbi:DUF2092 domain-containing protein [Microbulbifer epialgicus]|uniref:DUF2092 domain-containing protein n=1 Tax=Microbulbifer epialgicus TaxID=393907 RepID=A0ABV4P187_9GAMM